MTQDPCEEDEEKMISQVEVRKMLEHARTQYLRTVVLKDAVFWRKRIRVLEAELRKTPFR